jgi:hypothetical protein
VAPVVGIEERDHFGETVAGDVPEAGLHYPPTAAAAVHDLTVGDDQRALRPLQEDGLELAVPVEIGVADLIGDEKSGDRRGGHPGSRATGHEQ